MLITRDKQSSYAWIPPKTYDIYGFSHNLFKIHFLYYLVVGLQENTESKKNNATLHGLQAQM